MRDDTAIIIPVYNEGKVIYKVVSDVEKKFASIICVDDGSSDNSYNEIERSKAVLVRHPINLGQGAAIQTGIEVALQNPKIKYFVTFDADGQHQISDVIKMLEVLKKDGVDIVLGSRFKGKTENMPITKRLLLRLAIGFSNFTSGIKLTDTHNGLRVFNRKVAETLDITMPDMAHASEIIEKIAEKKYKYEEYPVTILYNEHSIGKGQSMFNAVNIGIDMLLRRLNK